MTTASAPAPPEEEQHAKSDGEDAAERHQPLAAELLAQASGHGDLRHPVTTAQVAIRKSSTIAVMLGHRKLNSRAGGAGSSNTRSDCIGRSRAPDCT